jgi:hypothetical protein
MTLILGIGLVACGGRTLGSGEAGETGDGTSTPSETEDPEDTESTSEPEPEPEPEPEIPEDCHLITEDMYQRASAQTLCEWAYVCDCEDLIWETFDECVDHFTTEMEEWQRIVQNAGLQYDPECLCLHQAEWDRRACHPIVGLHSQAGGSDPRNDYWCSTYHGDAKHGESCEWITDDRGVYVGDDCGPGLGCTYKRECWGPGAGYVPEILGEGEPCTNDGRARCDRGLMCMPDSDTCEPWGRPGDPCLDPSINGGHRCNIGAWCDYSTQTCVAAKPNGETCDTAQECLSYECAPDPDDWEAPGTCVSPQPLVCLDCRVIDCPPPF